MPERTPIRVAGFQIRLDPVESFLQLSERSWEAVYSVHEPQLGVKCPIELPQTLGAECPVPAWPEARASVAMPHRGFAPGLQPPKTIAPAIPIPAVLGRGIAPSGILKHLATPAGKGRNTGVPSMAEREGWAAPAVEIPGAPEAAGVTGDHWNSCATIAPEPAERWLSIVVAVEPLPASIGTCAPRFAMIAESDPCFRNPADNPPPAGACIPVPAAEAAERWLEPARETQFLTRVAAAVPSYRATIAPPSLEAAAWVSVLSPEPAARWVEPASAGFIDRGAAALRMRAFELPPAAPEELRDPAEIAPPAAESWAASSSAEPAERWLESATAEPVWTASVRLPQPALAARLAPPTAGAVPGLRPEAAARWIEPAMAGSFAAVSHDARQLPFAVAVHQAEIFRDPGDAPPAVAGIWAPIAAPEAAARWIEPASALSFARVAAAVRLLPFPVAPVAPRVLRDPAEAPPPVQESWMPVPAAEGSERWMASSTSNAAAATASIAAPATTLSIVSPFVPFIPRFARPQAPEPAAAFVRPAFRLLPVHPQMAFPPMEHEIGRVAQAGTLAGAASGLHATPVESAPASGRAPIPIRRAPAIPAAQHTESLPARLSPAGVSEIYPAAALHKQGVAAEIEVNPVQTITARPPAAQIERPLPYMPRTELRSLEYYCQRGNGSPSRRIGWAAKSIPPASLRFQMKPVFETVEEHTQPKPARKEPAIAEIFSLPEARQHRTQSRGLGWAGRVAAGIMVVFALWSGSKIAGIGKQAATVAHENPAPQRTSEAPPALAARETEPKMGPIAKFRQALANRAAVSVGDTFRGDMKAWGAAPGALPPGWSQSPEGYARVGSLALFQPTHNFRDYRLEFYGQIEKKSMGWVMRAKDKENYYAMKFTVVEPGLRPVIAMVHYPVVGGKKGHKVETPLSVMVHNNTPYHVTVDVKGNHFIAAIEGEQVDEWTDETPATGAVGFFSEAGEAARLYWTKVSKNQDWIGRFCSYLAGDEARRTAELWNPQMPPRSPAPPDPRPRDFIVSAAVESNLEEDHAPRRTSIAAKNWRIPSWIS